MYLNHLNRLCLSNFISFAVTPYYPTKYATGGGITKQAARGPCRMKYASQEEYDNAFNRWREAVAKRRYAQAHQAVTTESKCTFFFRNFIFNLHLYLLSPNPGELTFIPHYFQVNPLQRTPNQKSHKTMQTMKFCRNKNV